MIVCCLEVNELDSRWSLPSNVLIGGGNDEITFPLNIRFLPAVEMTEGEGGNDSGGWITTCASTSSSSFVIANERSECGNL
jgi:hypothetical protein